MGRIIVTQPSGKYAEWSTIVDHFVRGDCDRIDIIRARSLNSTIESIRRVNEICDYLDKNNGIHKYSGDTYEDLLEFAMRQHGEDDETVIILKEGIKMSVLDRLHRWAKNSIFRLWLKINGISELTSWENCNYGK